MQVKRGVEQVGSRPACSTGARLTTCARLVSGPIFIHPSNPVLALGSVDGSEFHLSSLDPIDFEADAAAAGAAVSAVDHADHAGSDLFNDLQRASNARQ